METVNMKSRVLNVLCDFRNWWNFFSDLIGLISFIIRRVFILVPVVSCWLIIFTALYSPSFVEDLVKLANNKDQSVLIATVCMLLKIPVLIATIMIGLELALTGTWNNKVNS